MLPFILLGLGALGYAAGGAQLVKKALSYDANTTTAAPSTSYTGYDGQLLSGLDLPSNLLSSAPTGSKIPYKAIALAGAAYITYKAVK